MSKQLNSRNEKPTLSLLNSAQSIVHEKKNNMIDKIWEDLVQNYSFLDNNIEEGRADEYKTYKQFNEDYLPSFMNYNSLDHSQSSDSLELDKLRTIFSDKRRREEFYKFTKAIQLSQSFILILGQNGCIQYVNPHFQKISGYTQDEIVGKNLNYLISTIASHEEYEDLLGAMKSDMSWSGELVNCKKNGEWYIFNAKISPISSNKRELKEFIMVGHDVTSFRETEIKLEQAIQDKSILVSELHNRVKNNLQIVSNLMQIQASDEGNEDVKRKLQTIAGRVKTIANIHEILFDFTSFNSLDFSKNIPKIVDLVTQMYAKPNSNINITYDIEPLILDVNQAHPCALLVNEIITNSFKRSITTDSNDLQIEIALNMLGNQVMIDIVSSNTEIFNINDLTEESLSSNLINSLTSQLKGTCSYLVNENNTSFSLVFEKDNRTGTGNTRLK